MNTRSIVNGLMLSTLALGSSLAMADPQGWPGWDRDGGRDYPEAHYGWARVVGVEPLRTGVRVTVPHQECYRETRWEGGRSDGRIGDRERAGATVLGGLLGAVVGHQIGDGDGQRVATVAGALLGAGVAHEAVEQAARREEGERYEHQPYDGPHPVTFERCGTRYEERWEERVTGYHVTYEYDGRIGVTDLPTPPGRYIRVRVSIRPDRDD